MKLNKRLVGYNILCAKYVKISSVFQIANLQKKLKNLILPILAMFTSYVLNRKIFKHMESIWL